MAGRRLVAALVVATCWSLLATASAEVYCQTHQLTATVQQLRAQLNTPCTYNGSLEVEIVEQDLASAGGVPTVDVPFLQVVNGNLSISTTSSTSLKEFVLSASALSIVDGTLTISDIALAGLSFPNLTAAASFVIDNVSFTGTQRVVGVEEFLKLPSFGSISLSGTNVQSFAGWSQLLREASGNSSITIRDNPALLNVSLPGLSENEGWTYIDISNNNATVSVNISDAQKVSLYLEGVQTFQAANLSQLSQDGPGASGFYNNGFTELELPALINVSGTLSVVNNPKLQNLSLPSLQSVTALDITGNPLHDIDLRALTEIETMMELSTNLTLPALNSTVGSDFAVPAGHILECTFAIGDARSCTSTSVSTPSTTGSSVIAGPTVAPSSNATSHPGHKDTSGLSTGAKIGLGIGLGLGIPVLLGMIIFCCISGRRKQRRSPRSQLGGTYAQSERCGREQRQDPTPARYSKVPSEAVQERHDSERSRPVSSLLGPSTTPANGVVDDKDLVELEEQQVVRHEMDARSLPDMELGDEDEVDARSLEDIERSHERDSTTPVSPIVQT